MNIDKIFFSTMLFIRIDNFGFLMIVGILILFVILAIGCLIHYIINRRLTKFSPIESHPAKMITAEENSYNSSNINQYGTVYFIRFYVKKDDKEKVFGYQISWDEYKVLPCVATGILTYQHKLFIRFEFDDKIIEKEHGRYEIKLK